MKFLKVLLLSVFFPFILFAQEVDVEPSKASLSGYWRNYFATTVNKGELKDYSALATGGKLKFQYKLDSAFEIGAAGYTSVSLGIQDLGDPDVATGQVSRYEEGLFNVLNPRDKFVFVLGELYAKYRLQNHELMAGRFIINSPFINGQDGRMIPTFVQGLWYKSQYNKHFFQGGIINEIAPRSTARFFNIGESIGTYGQGRDIYGKKSNYFGNTNSDFVAMLNTNLHISDKVGVDIWNYYTDNISNTLYVNPTFVINKQWSAQVEWLHQNKVGDGGNASDSIRYFQQKKADVLGAQIQYAPSKTKFSLAYDYILPGGRFVFPREWGREFLFSFQKRERSEGSANNHAIVAYVDNNFKLGASGNSLRSILSVGKHWKASVSEPESNKYAVPDYTQVNLDLFVNFKKLKNFKPELLLSGKFANGDFPDKPNFYMNKVDMFHLDLVLNYVF